MGRAGDHRLQEPGGLGLPGEALQLRQEMLGGVVDQGGDVVSAVEEGVALEDAEAQVAP